MWGSIPECCNHDLSSRQTLNKLSHPGVSSLPNFNTLIKMGNLGETTKSRLCVAYTRASSNSTSAIRTKWFSYSDTLAILRYRLTTFSRQHIYKFTAIHNFLCVNMKKCFQYYCISRFCLN